MSSKQKMVTIVDDTGHSLVLRPAEKVAIVTTSTNVPKEKRPKAIFFELQSQLADARDQDGRHVMSPMPIGSISSCEK